MNKSDKIKQKLARMLVSAPKLSLALALILCAFLCAFVPKLAIDASTQTLLLENDKDLEYIVKDELAKKGYADEIIEMAISPITYENEEVIKAKDDIKEIKAKSQIDFEMFLNKLDLDMVKKVKHKIHAQ